MNKKNSKKLSTWQSFISKIKTNLKPVILNFEEFNRKYPNINQTIQLTFIYFFAVKGNYRLAKFLGYMIV